MQEYLKNLSGHQKIFLQLREGEMKSLSKAGKLDEASYTYDKITRWMPKEEWIRFAFAAAGSGYKQSINKQLIWNDAVLNLAFVEGSNRSDLATSSYEQHFSFQPFFNKNKTELIETILVAKIIYGIFNTIKTWNKTRTTKRHMNPDTEQGQRNIENQKKFTEVLNHSSYIGVGLFFHCLDYCTGNDRKKRKEVIDFLLGGSILSTSSSSSGATKPSPGMENAFRKRAAMDRWLNKNKKNLQQWQILDNDKPYTQDAISQKAQHLVKWCWEICKVMCNVFAGSEISSLTENVTQTKSSKFIELCQTELARVLSDQAHFPTKESQSTGTSAFVAAHSGAVVEETPLEEDIWDMVKEEIKEKLEKSIADGEAHIEVFKELLEQQKSAAPKIYGPWEKIISIKYKIDIDKILSSEKTEELSSQALDAQTSESETQDDASIIEKEDSSPKDEKKS